MTGDGGSCPSNLTNMTQMTQVTEVSDLTSLSSCQEQERIALLIGRCQRGEAEGAQSANEVFHSINALHVSFIVAIFPQKKKNFNKKKYF